MAKKKKLSLEERRLILEDQIHKHHDNFKVPILNKDNKQTIITNSWFDISEYKNKQLFDSHIIFENDIIKSSIKDDNYYTKIYQLLPDENQKQILLKWMDCYTLMYNTIVRYIKRCRFEKKKVDFDITSLKKLHFNAKKEIIKWSQLQINGKIITVDSHLLDYAIKDSINRYRSSLTNLKKGNIKHFRLRYLKMNRPNRIIKIEKLAVRKDGFCVSSLGNNMKTTCNNLNFLENMHTVAIVRYCNGKYHILFKYPTKNKSKKELTNKTVAIDPGMRKFGMGYSNDKVISLCETSKYKIIKKLENIDKISKSNLEEHKKQKSEE
jgi:hypothetical protein